MNLSVRVYKSVSGLFVQDPIDSNPSLILPAAPPGFGLIDNTPERWENFERQLRELNQSAPSGTSYKAFFFSRHGQGYHNVAEAKYGTQAWDEMWSKMNGDDELTWGPDPQLTAIGEDQAFCIRSRWESELSFGIPLPDKLYCSPLTRALKTCEIVFEGLIPQESDKARSVTILENCREENGVHTCDKRNTRTYIAKKFPRFSIERGFSEEDELWDPEIRESKNHIAQRAKQVLDIVFANDISASYISVTGHGGIINGFLNVIGRVPYALPTGGVLPVVIECRVYN